MELISIIIPCYNYGHLIDQTIDSIINQTYSEWEVIIINDGSKDNTEEVVLKYQLKCSKIKYFSINNSGPSHARNTGIKAAVGEYIMFIDADDLMRPGKLWAHIKHFESFPKLDISYSEGLYFDHRYPEVFYRKGSLRNKAWIPILEDQVGYPVIKELIQNNIMPICAPLFRAQVIRNVGLLDENYFYMEDWDYFVRCALTGYRFGYLSGIENAVLIRVQKISLSKNTTKMALHEAKLRKKFAESLDMCNVNSDLNLSDSEIHALKKLNILQMYRAYLRAGEWNVISKLFCDDLGINIFRKTQIFAFDAMRYLKHLLST